MEQAVALAEHWVGLHQGSLRTLGEHARARGRSTNGTPRQTRARNLAAVAMRDLLGASCSESSPLLGYVSAKGCRHTGSQKAYRRGLQDPEVAEFTKHVREMLGL